MHHGVGMIIANKEKEQFFVQRKDKNYPVHKWRDAFSFWGGKIEDEDSSSLEALIRELQEEINYEFDTEQIKFVHKFLVKSDHDFVFYLYELLIDNKTLLTLNQSLVKEGYSELCTKDKLLKGKWIWGLEQVILHYFDR